MLAYIAIIIINVGTDVADVVTDGVGDESESDPRSAAKRRKTEDVDISKYTVSAVLLAKFVPEINKTIDLLMISSIKF